MFHSLLVLDIGPIIVVEYLPIATGNSVACGLY